MGLLCGLDCDMLRNPPQGVQKIFREVPRRVNDRPRVLLRAPKSSPPGVDSKNVPWGPLDQIRALDPLRTLPP